MDPTRFRVFEGDEALSVLDVMVEHFMIRKFLGPFPPSMTHWMEKKFIFNPFFTIEKTDSTELYRKYRTIFNAAAERPKTQFQKDVVNGVYDNHPDFLEFMELAAIHTLNENIIKEDISLDSVKEIIRGMYLHNFMWKSDLFKGYRGIFRNPDQFLLCYMFVRVIHPISGVLWEFITVDPTLLMGSSNSVAQFSLPMMSFVRACVFHRPDLFSKDPSNNDYNMRCLFSYLDDFMCSARSFAHATEQFVVFSLLGAWIGPVFSPKKFEPPSQEQTLLGIVYNFIWKCIALKEKKPQKVLAILKEFANAAVWKARDIEVILGNLIWVSYVLPKIRAFTTPFILFYVIANSSPGRKILRVCHPRLNQQTKESLALIMYLVSLNPKYCVFVFLSMYKTRKVFGFSDAVGWEIHPRNPTSGCLGGFFYHPRLAGSIAFVLPWSTIFQLLPSSVASLPHMLFPHINYLEFTAAWILIVWVILKYHKWVCGKRIIFKMDSMVSKDWFANGRVSTAP